MAATHFFTDVFVEESKVLTQASFLNSLNGKTFYTLLYNCATNEEQAQYDTLLKLYDNNYEKVSREILIDWVKKTK